ncbi:MAG: hypothetical protein P1U63_04470 [Coxiellaceae bacterium]|nr:hypothetical protein [Coxiellaceae bacterium]
MASTSRSAVSGSQQQALSKRNKHVRNTLLLSTLSVLSLAGLAYTLYKAKDCYDFSIDMQAWNIMQKHSNHITTKVGVLAADRNVDGNSIWDDFISSIGRLGYTLQPTDSTAIELHSYDTDSFGYIPVNKCSDAQLHAAARNDGNLNLIYDDFMPKLLKAGGSLMGQNFGILMAYAALVTLTISCLSGYYANKQHKLANEQRLFLSNYIGDRGAALMDTQDINDPEAGLEMQSYS